MENTITKIDDSTIEVVKAVQVPEPTKTTYTMDFLKSQELSILKSMNDFVSARQIELGEVRGLIDEAEKLGIKTSIQVQAEQVIAEQSKLDAQPI